MKNKLALLTMIVLFHTTFSWATPIISASGVKNLDVGGVLYDVSIGDGNFISTYGTAPFSVDYSVAALAIGQALIDLFNAQSIASTSFNGLTECDTSSSFCIIAIPSRVFTQSDGDISYVTGRSPSSDFSNVNLECDDSGNVWQLWCNGFAAYPVDDSRWDTGLDTSLTLGTFRLSSSVPTPATLALFGLGLAGLGWSRRSKA